MESGLGGFGGIHGGSHASASSSDVFDQFDGVAPHVIGQAAHEFAQTQTVHLVRGEVARLNKSTIQHKIQFTGVAAKKS